ncbi:MAG: cell division protein ZapA [Desulfovibrio sp.]|nr:cell division protein ZapA [Desulfovibrio sp.]
MSQENLNFTVLGQNIAFKPGADVDRVRSAAALVEERFANLKVGFHGGQKSEALVIFMALGLADELLQAKIRLDEAQYRIGSMLDKIEDSIQG